MTERPVDGDQSEADWTGNACSFDGTPRSGVKRKPDGNEAIDRHQDDDPCGHVLRQQRQEHDATAWPVVDVHQLKPGDDADPSFKRADVQHRRVGDG